MTDIDSLTDAELRESQADVPTIAEYPDKKGWTNHRDTSRITLGSDTWVSGKWVSTSDAACRREGKHSSIKNPYVIKGYRCGGSTEVIYYMEGSSS